MKVIENEYQLGQKRRGMGRTVGGGRGPVGLNVRMGVGRTVMSPGL
jgi:hypothetical protein